MANVETKARVKWADPSLMEREGILYNVEILTSIDRKMWWYAGTGRFCRGLDEALEYAAKNATSGVDDWEVCYYWFDTEHGGCLYRGERDEDGKRDRDTEVLILTEVYALADVDPNPENWEAEGVTDSMVWKAIDEYIERQLGYLPDYEIN